jgi:1-acyl-sn-glycerol-3-phosphate acyltransferase
MQMQTLSHKAVADRNQQNNEPHLTNSKEILYQLSRSAVNLYTRMMLETNIRWHHPLPDGPKILAANHPTTTDPIYLLSLFPEPVSLLLTAASFDIPLLGRYLRTTNHIPAVRSSGGSTVDAVVRTIESGRSVCIFPEGALSPLDGSFHRPRSGIARVAMRTGAPVIPIGIGIQQERMWVTHGTVQGERARGQFYFQGPYAITVGRPLHLGGNVHDRAYVRGAADLVMSHIRNLARESEDRIQAAQTVDLLSMLDMLIGAY